MKILSATGHRPNKLGGYDTETKDGLVSFAELVIMEWQPEKIISGVALGWDMAIATAAINCGIDLVCAVPFRDQWKRWTSDDIKAYQEILKKADQIVYVDELEGYECSEVSIGKYHIEKMQLRNKWMVDNSDGILALWNATPGGTKNCVDYAKTRYDFPKDKIIYLWESWSNFKDSKVTHIKEDVIVETKKELDVLVVDVLDEIYQESTAGYLSKDVSSDDSETSGFGDNLKDIGDAIADEILGVSDKKSDEILYPHQLNPDLPFSPYNAVYNTGKFIHVDEEYLAANLHWKPEFDYSQCEWEPKRIADYRECKRVYLDIETLGLDASDPECRCIMIGLKIEGNFLGNSQISKKAFDMLSAGFILELDEEKFGNANDAEKNILSGLFRVIKQLEPDTIVTHNGFNFDFTFIMKRCEVLEIEHPMTRITDKERVITAASMYGQPIRYFPVYWTKPNGRGKVYNDGSFPQLVDTMHLAGQHDKIFANMSGYGLKYLASYVGFRKEKRLELKAKEIKEYWESRDNDKKQLIRDYLIFDLEDQQAVTNFFLVSPYYQQMYFPLPLQEICVASPARKHNANLDKFYRKYYDKTITLPDGNRKFYTRPEADEKVSYEGAIVDIIPGIYKNFFKLDLASLYPSIVLRFGLMNSQKDPLGVFFKTMETLRALRFVYKDLGGNEPENARTREAYNTLNYLFSEIDLSTINKDDKNIFKGIDNSLKVGINGGYGFLGVGFYNFNDIMSAALVTAYGRVIITEIRKILSIYSHEIECFTAETLVLTDKGHFPINELIGTTHKVVDGNGDWSDVEFNAKGIDKIWEVTLKRTREIITIRCNSRHKWWIYPRKQASLKNDRTPHPVTTNNLLPLLNKKWGNSSNIGVPFVLPKKPSINDDYYNGVVHGITYGDGSRTNTNINRFYIQLVGNKCELIEYFNKSCNISNVTFKNGDRGDDIYYRYTCTKYDLKETPPLSVSNSYLLGFFRGLLATDGSTSTHKKEKKGNNSTSISGIKSVCDFIEKIANRIGHHIVSNRLSSVAGSVHKAINGKPVIQRFDNYEITIDRSNLSEDDFLRSFHRNKFLDSLPIGSNTSYRNNDWIIIDVKETNDYEIVYGGTEPNTHRFVLSKGIVSGNTDTDGQFSVPKQINEISLEHQKSVKHPKTGELIYFGSEHGYDTVSLDYIWGVVQEKLPDDIKIDLELRCPEGILYAPAMKNYIFWEKPGDKPKLKGVFRKRNRSELQKEFPIEFIRLWGFEGKQQAFKFSNEWISKLTGFKCNSKNLLISHTIIDPKAKKLSGDEKRLNKLLIESGCGKIGETIVYYWGSRKTFSASGRSAGIKPFPIRRYPDNRCPDSDFPCDPVHVNKQPNVKEYVKQLETKVIPYSQAGQLNSLLDMGLVSKLMFTNRIGKADKKLSGAGMGEVGDTVSFYWGSIGSYSPTGKRSAKCDRFPVRVIINDDDSLTIDLQEIPPDIDKSLINLNFNVEWYLEDLLKIRDDILGVVDK